MNRDAIALRLQSLQRGFTAFTPGQKVVSVIGAIALLLGGVMVYKWVSTPSYAPLFTSMAPADASAVVDKLNADGTPYKLTDGGSTVLVPASDVYDARIKLSGEGLPAQSTTDGYGLLDKQNLSTSTFGEQTTYKRAIEGELDKTVEALDDVNTAVVHVAMPQEQLFSTDKEPVTASVLVEAQPGTTLSTSEVQGIVHLVASSVEGLDPKDVTVTDSTGTVLSSGGGDDTFDSVGDTRAQQVSGFENRMSTSVESVLDRIVGPGNSATQVTADLDFDKTLTHSVRYFNKPKVPPLTSTEKKEKYGNGSPSTTGGVVGPAGQLTPGASPSAGSNYENTEKTSDNALDKTVEDREQAPGNVRSLHVGVVIDTRSLAGTTPNQVQALITSALGIDTKRGDTVSVATMPFNRSAQTAAAAQLAAAQKVQAHGALMSNIRTGGIALVVVAALIVSWLRGRKRRKLRDQATTYVVEQLRNRTEPAVALPPNPSPGELSGPDGSQLRLAARDEIAAMVEGQPEEVAQLLRGWLVEVDR